MSDSTATAAGRRPGAPPAACPGPEAAYPDDLSRLSLVELHVWHSRTCRQLHQDLAAPEGPHPVVLDRHLELVAELDARGDRPLPPGTVC